MTGRLPISRKIPTKSLPLHRQELRERRAAPSAVSARIISRTARIALLLEEHVLGAAEADPLGAEDDGDLRVGRACRRWRARRGGGACPPTSGSGRTRGRSRTSRARASSRGRPAGPRRGASAARRGSLLPSCRRSRSSRLPRPRGSSTRIRASLVDRGSPRRRRRRSCPCRARRRRRAGHPARVVRIPAAACMPAMSSGEVSSRTSTTGLPLGRHRDGLRRGQARSARRRRRARPAALAEEAARLHRRPPSPSTGRPGRGAGRAAPARRARAPPPPRSASRPPCRSRSAPRRSRCACRCASGADRGARARS